MPTMITLVDGTVPVAADFNSNFSALNQAVGTGTSITTYTTGDILYASAANTLAKLTIGSTDQVLKVSGGVPTWGSASSSLNAIAGLTLSNNSGDANNDIDIAAGAAVSNDSTIANRVDMVLTSGLTKKLDATWAVGTNQGGLDTGAEANSTWYHVFLIKRVDTGVVDVLFSTSPTAPTMPTSYTKARRIGSFYNDSGGNIVAFSQAGDEFLWVTAPALDLDSAASGTTSTTQTVTVPTGVVVWAFGRTISTTSHIYLSSLVQTDQTPSATASPLAHGGAFTTIGIPFGPIRTNTSAQIRWDATANAAFRIQTAGWIDRRGRDD